MSLWADCGGEACIGPLQGTLLRLVESQEQIATLGYVDTLDEQALLEQMLESVKPPSPSASDDLHYLLRTPFRYPPLRYGSRFGRTSEPSIFYGAGGEVAALAESAYYRWVFWYAMDAPPPKPVLRSTHTVFSVDYASAAGVRLQCPPFDKHRAQLAHPADYSMSQAMGADMRAAGVKVFEYRSARDPGGGHCVGLFDPTPFVQTAPTSAHEWLCETTALRVTFKRRDRHDLSAFEYADFAVDGVLPQPA